MGTDRNAGRIAVPATAAVAIVALATPIGYVSYAVIVRWLQGYSIVVNLSPAGEVGLFALLVGATGGLSAWTAARGLRLTAGAIALAIVFWPWVYVSVPVGNAGYAAIPFVWAVLAAGIGTTVRSPSKIRRRLRESVGRYVLAGGIVHFVAGFGLQAWARTTNHLLGALPLFILVGLGLAGTGSLAVLLWVRYDLVTPAVATVGWFAWGSYGLWLTRATLPWSQFRGFAWVSLQPYPDYAVQWQVLLLAIVWIGACEYTIRRRTQSRDWRFSRS